LIDNLTIKKQALTYNTPAPAMPDAGVVFR